MARLSDFSHAVRSVGFWAFCKRVYQQISEDMLFTWASALAYAWLFAVFPFVIFLLTLAPYLPLNTRENAQQELNQAIARTTPGPAGQTLQENIDRVMNEPRGGLLSVGLIVAIWVASGGMAMTMQALDNCYDIAKPRSFIKQRTIAVLLTIAGAVLILLVMILMPIGTLIINWMADRAGTLGGPLLWGLNIGRYVLALALLFILVGMTYYFGPSLRTKFHIITPGAVFTVAVWLLLGFGFRWYINTFARYDQMYGAVGGVAVLLVLFYINALVLLVGAEVNSEVDFIALGLPSAPGERPEEAAAHAAPPDEETEELTRELQEKRREDLAAPAGSAGGGGGVPRLNSAQREAAAEDAEPPPPPEPRRSRWVLALATLGVVLVIDKLRPRSKGAAKPSSPQRLKDAYPVTYAALSPRDGSGGRHDHNPGRTAAK
jgi:membrane protein